MYTKIFNENEESNCEDAVIKAKFTDRLVVYISHVEKEKRKEKESAAYLKKCTVK